MAAAKNHAKAGGRKSGIPNKVTRELREMAQSYGPEGLQIAVRIMRNPKLPASARIAAIDKIWDRAYGKPAQAVSHSGTVGTYDLEQLSKLPLDDLRKIRDILGPAALVGADRPSDSPEGS